MEPHSEQAIYVTEEMLVELIYDVWDAMVTQIFRDKARL